MTSSSDRFDFKFKLGDSCRLNQKASDANSDNLLQMVNLAKKRMTSGNPKPKKNSRKKQAENPQQSESRGA